MKLFVTVVMRSLMCRMYTSDMLATQSFSAVRYLPPMFELFTNAPPHCCCHTELQSEKYTHTCLNELQTNKKRKNLDNKEN
jgi:hypothetical protein